MYLNKNELTDILELMERFQVESVKIESDSSSGIGSVVTTEFPLTLNETYGRFMVTISDETDW